MSKKKIAIIGCGNIANFHVPALRSAGFECVHCASSPNSKTINKFANKYKINQVWNEPNELAAAKDQWDGLVISSTIESTLDLLKLAISSNKPILVEKPVAISSSPLADYAAKAPRNVIVAYNRRHYNTVQKARDFVKNKTNIRATMLLPENVTLKSKNPFFSVFTNSVHGIDILNFIFDKVSLEHVETANNDNPFFGRQAILKSSAGHIINVMMNWKAPTNFSLSLDDAHQRLDLFPFEKFKLYEGMRVIESSDEYPVKQYVPNLVESGNVFDDAPSGIKPGFLGQAIEFFNLVNGKSPMVGANLKDAFTAQVMVEKIIGSQKP